MDKAQVAKRIDYVEAYLNGFDWLDYFEKQNDTDIGKLYSELMGLCRIHHNLYKMLENDLTENDIEYPSLQAYNTPMYQVYSSGRKELSLLTEKLIAKFTLLGETV